MGGGGEGARSVSLLVLCCATSRTYTLPEKLSQSSNISTIGSPPLS